MMNADPTNSTRHNVLEFKVLEAYMNHISFLDEERKKKEDNAIDMMTPDNLEIYIFNN